jgi:ATP-binding cassette subfamily B protein
MPTLLPFSIGENIAMGKKGATQKEVEDAARLANAHDFISSLPEK